MSFETLKTNTSSTTITTTTETVGVTSDAVSYGQTGGQGMRIRGTVNVTAGAGTTAVVIRVRNGSGITGAPHPGTGFTHTLAAGASASIPFDVMDSTPIPTPAGDAQGADQAGANLYSVTVQQTGATGNGTINYASIEVSTATAGW